VAAEAIALAGLDTRAVECEIHRRQRAAGCRAGRHRLAAQTVLAVLVVGALVVLAALLRTLAHARLAGAAGTALTVGCARLALARLADLAVGALLVVLALRLGDARVCTALFACGTLTVVVALDALVLGADLAVFAVLICLAAGVLALVATRHRKHDRQHGR